MFPSRLDYEMQMVYCETAVSTTRFKELTAANVNFDDPEEMAEFMRQDVERAGARIREAVKKLQDQGILDAEYNLIPRDLPPDMAPDSKTDFGG